MGDFVLLPKIDMDSFLSNLKMRYAAGLIYTFIGEVCVSVNPYKTMDIYGKTQVNQYKVSNLIRLITNASAVVVVVSHEVL